MTKTELEELEDNRFMYPSDAVVSEAFGEMTSHMTNFDNNEGWE